MPVRSATRETEGMLSQKIAMKEETGQDRFKDEGTMVWDYLDRVIVHCPKCTGRATITNDGKWHFKNPRLYCPDCHHHQTQRMTRYVAELKYNCPDCGERIEESLTSLKQKRKEIKVKCPTCGQVHAHQPKYTEQQWIFLPGEEGTDPFFRLPLWLRGPVKKHLFWAYNYEHLATLKGYIGARLRTRSGKGYTSMVEKLPAWISSAKNREELVRLIGQLEKK